MTIKLVLFDLGDTLIEQKIDDKQPLDCLSLVPFPDSLGVLDTLYGRYQMAILSDTTQSDCAAVARSLEKLNMRRYFDEIITSVDVGCRKPDRGMFAEALKRFGFDASQTVMVGNDYEKDIVGASRCGIAAVWIRRNTELDDNASTLADYIVASMAEVPNALNSIDKVLVPRSGSGREY